jgi:hypothetical protein
MLLRLQIQQVVADDLWHAEVIHTSADSVGAARHSSLRGCGIPNSR